MLIRDAIYQMATQYFKCIYLSYILSFGVFYKVAIIPPLPNLTNKVVVLTPSVYAMQPLP